MPEDDIERIRPHEIDTAAMATLDVRKHPGKEQIRGALRYDPRALLTEERLALPLPHDRRFVVYGDDDDDGTAIQVASHLAAQGYAGAAILEGGFQAYKAAGLQTEDATQEQPVPGNESSGIPRL